MPMLHENLERNFGFLVHDVARLLRLTFDRRVKSMGLTRSQWWVLTHLFRNEGITQSELAEVLEVERPTLGRLLDRLEASGWAKRVFITEAVEPQMRAMRALAAGVRGDALNGLTREEQEHFVDTLLTVKANLLRLGNGNGLAGIAADEDEGGADLGAEPAQEVVSP